MGGALDPPPPPPPPPALGVGSRVGGWGGGFRQWGGRSSGNDTSGSTGRSGRQNAVTRRNMRREDRVTVQGPVKKQRPDGMSHRGSVRLPLPNSPQFPCHSEKDRPRSFSLILLHTSAVRCCTSCTQTNPQLPSPSATLGGRDGPCAALNPPSGNLWRRLEPPVLEGRSPVRRRAVL